MTIGRAYKAESPLLDIPRVVKIPGFSEIECVGLVFFYPFLPVSS